MKVNPHKSSTGMDANTLALLCYIAAFVLGWIPRVTWIAWVAPLVIFLIEKNSPFVKFHAIQAFFLEAVGWGFTVVFSLLGLTAPVLSIIVLSLIRLALTVLAIIALVKASSYYEYKLPIIGDFALKLSRSGQAPM